METYSVSGTQPMSRDYWALPGRRTYSYTGMDGGVNPKVYKDDASEWQIEVHGDEAALIVRTKRNFLVSLSFKLPCGKSIK